MDSAKLKKLQDYSFFLTQQAEAKEARGEGSEAVKDYVKLVDVLLLLANESKDHPTWQQLIGRAEEYQRKARALAGPGAEGSLPPPRAAAIVPIAGKTERVAVQSSVAAPTSAMEPSSSSTNRFKTLRKFPSLIGRKGEGGTGVETTPTKAYSSEVIRKSTQQPSGTELVIPNNSAGGSQLSALAVEEKTDIVPYAAYSKLLEEKTKLQREVEALQEKEKEYLESIGAKDRVYAEALSNMVPKSEYDLLLAKLEDSVPRADYEAALTISAIPKERYIELQSQLTDLELRLANSVPRIIVDEIAEYVSFLASTVLSSATPEEKERKVDGFLAFAPKKDDEVIVTAGKEGGAVPGIVSA